MKEDRINFLPKKPEQGGCKNVADEDGGFRGKAS